MYIFIINPVAGNGRAKKIFSKLAGSQVYKGIKSTCFFTRFKGHAEEITRQIVTDHHDKIKGIIVIGGDGTLHEVMNGLTNRSIPVSCIPGGSGNDFSRGASILERPIDLLETIVHENARSPYWLGTFQTDAKNDRLFTNNISFGFDAEVAQTVNESWYKKFLNKLGLGKISYVIALIQVLIRFKPIDVKIKMNGKKFVVHNCWMVTVTNHPFYGGGMKIIPQSKIQPTYFPVLFIHSISKIKVLSLFMTVFVGKHLRFREIEITETTNIQISSNQPLIYQADGETATCQNCIVKKQSKPIWIIGSSQY